MLAYNFESMALVGVGVYIYIKTNKLIADGTDLLLGAFHTWFYYFDDPETVVFTPCPFQMKKPVQKSK